MRFHRFKKLWHCAEDFALARKSNLAREQAYRPFLTLTGHTQSVEHIDFSHDGSRLASASNDKTARVWDCRTGKNVLTLQGYRDFVRCAVFTPDDSQLAVISNSESAPPQFFDSHSGEKVRSLDFVGEHKPTRLIFAPDGKTFVTTGYGHGRGQVRIWSERTLENVSRFLDHDGATLGAAFSPDGSRLLTVGMDRTARMVDLESGRAIFMFTRHSASVYCAAFSPDGKVAATGSDDCHALIWNAANRFALQDLRHRGSVTGLSFSQDGALLATASWWNGVKLWDVASGALLQNLSFRSSRDVKFSPNGETIAATFRDGNVRLWRAAEV